MEQEAKDEMRNQRVGELVKGDKPKEEEKDEKDEKKEEKTPAAELPGAVTEA